MKQASARSASLSRWSEVHGRHSRETRTAFFSLCESRHASGNLPRHRHDRAYACVVIEGAFEERARGRLESATAGTILFHPAGDEHDDRFASSGAVCVNVAPTEAWLEAAADDGDSLFGRYRVFRGDVALDIGHSLRRHLGAEDTSARLSVEAATLALLAEAASAHAPCEVPGRWVDRICADIRSAPGAEWTLAGIAAAARVHPMHVARTFRRRTGSSLGHFVRSERLSWARRELATDAPLAQIALEAGFYDESHFIRAFRRHFGTTPGRCRRRRLPP